jgi:hypothetical protein
MNYLRSKIAFHTRGSKYLSVVISDRYSIKETSFCFVSIAIVEKYEFLSNISRHIDKNCFPPLVTVGDRFKHSSK